MIMIVVESNKKPTDKVYKEIFIPLTKKNKKQKTKNKKKQIKKDKKTIFRSSFFKIIFPL